MNGSDKRIWKYNQSNNELVPGIQSLNPNKTHSSFNVHQVSNNNNRMTVHGSGFRVAGPNQEIHNFKTS